MGMRILNCTNGLTSLKTDFALGILDLFFVGDFLWIGIFRTIGIGLFGSYWDPKTIFHNPQTTGIFFVGDFLWIGILILWDLSPWNAPPFGRIFVASLFLSASNNQQIQGFCLHPGPRLWGEEKTQISVIINFTQFWLMKNYPHGTVFMK